MPDRQTDDRRWYDGTSGYLRWGPKFFLAMAVVLYAIHLNHWIQFSTAFLVVAFIHSRWLPWRFEIRDDGVEMRFEVRESFVSMNVREASTDSIRKQLDKKTRGNLSDHHDDGAGSDEQTSGDGGAGELFAQQ